MKCTELSRFYNTRAWRDMQMKHLFKYPQCVKCNRKGYMKAADVVGHIIEPRQNQALMLDKDNLQSLCNSCSDPRR